MFIYYNMYLQIDVDIGSSTVANGVLRIVLGAITTLVVDMAFLVQVLANFGLLLFFNFYWNLSGTTIFPFFFSFSFLFFQI
jgi:Protein ENHANCED DISEASE RESISTANCE 2, C-terminal